ncbi:MAG: type VI secretion system ATPase TssH, partial [Thiotrichaceae bacterium]
IDDSVVFRPLGKAEIRQIAALQLKLLNKRLKGNELTIDFSDAALDLLGEEGFDPVFGARPLKRAIQSEIENPLAQMILGGEFSSGDAIYVDVVDGKMTFTKS